VITETAPASLAGQNRAFRGDLATIVGKALEKDPARRYGSVAELAGDVRRYLRREPIAARPAKAIYQLRKFAQRHQGLVGGVAATLLVLIAGVVVSVVFAVGQTRALEESQRQRRIAEAVNEFLNKDLLGKADPYGGATHDASLREVLDQAAAAIESRFLDEPLVHASIRSTLGKTYYQLGDYDESARHLEVALATYRAEYGAGGAETIPLWHLLVQTHNFAWRLDDAEALLADFLPAVEDAFGPDHLHTAQAHADYGVLRRRQNRYEEAEHAYLRAIEIYERDPGTKPRTLAITRENLGIVYEKMNRFADAERLMEQAVETFERDSGPDSADVAYGLTNLGHIYRQGRGPPDGLDLAQQCFERAYAIRRERLGENHIETLRTHASIARLHENRGEHAFAEEVQRDVLARRERTLAPDHLDVLTSTSDLAISIENQGRVEEAVDLCRTVLDRGQGHWGPEYPNVNFWRRQLVRLLTKLDDQDGVRAVYEEQRALLERAVAEPDPDVKHVKALSGFLMMCEDDSLRDLDRALELAEQAVQMTEGQDPVALDNLARALLRSGREDAALEMQARALAAFEHRAQGAGASASAINEFARALVLCEVEDARDPTKALPVAERAVEASGRRIPHILDTLALVLAENGRLDEAIDTKERVIALIPPGDPTWRARIQATLDELVARRAKAASDPT
jgi:tetratricopeptide (TPR) repeat protein